MINRLIDIRDTSFIKQFDTSNFTTCSFIDYQFNLKGQGAVGTVHHVDSVDGKRAEKLLLKIVSEEHLQKGAYESIQLLHEKIKQDSSLNGRTLYQEYPELMGFPFLVFKANDSSKGEEIVGMLMFDLNAYGYEDMGADDWNVVDYVTKVSLKDRIFLAYQYARSISYLNTLQFIHCDLKEQSVFINKRLPTLTLIDFDGGFNYDKQKSGLTLGAITSWMSSIIRNAIKKGKSSKDFTAEERLREEHFYIAAGIYNIIFGVSPYFFLKDANEETILEYLNENKWPSIDDADTLLNSSNKKPHEYCIQVLQQLTSEGYEQLTDALIFSFNKGFKDEKMRINALEWERVIWKAAKEIVGTPHVNHFRSDKKIIRHPKEAVQLSWDAKYFKYATESDKNLSLFENTTDVLPKDEVVLSLKLYGYFGSASEQLEIKADKKDPEILLFQSSVQYRTTTDPVILSWKTKDCERVLISTHNEDLPANGALEIDPKDKTVYTLTAFGNFGQRKLASLEIDVIRPSITEFRYEINIEHGIDNVDLHWKTENALSAEISPRIGNVNPSSTVHIGIPDRTTFTLTAKGHFGSTSKTIEAAPFPLPIIKTLLVPTPEFNLETSINTEDLQIPHALLNMPGFTIDNTIQIAQMPEFSSLNSDLNEALKNISYPKINDQILNQILNKTKTKD